jgi:hypothetical protein
MLSSYFTLTLRLRIATSLDIMSMVTRLASPSEILGELGPLKFGDVGDADGKAGAVVKRDWTVSSWMSALACVKAFLNASSMGMSVYS